MNKPTREQQLEKLKNMSDSDIDYSDIPPITKDMLKDAVITDRKIINGKLTITSQTPYLDVVKPRQKERLHARIDGDVLAWFKSQGKGYQTHINAVLRTYYQSHKQQIENLENISDADIDDNDIQPIQKDMSRNAVISKPRIKSGELFVTRQRKRFPSRTQDESISSRSTK